MNETLDLMVMILLLWCGMAIGLIIISPFIFYNKDNRKQFIKEWKGD